MNTPVYYYDEIGGNTSADHIYQISNPANLSLKELPVPTQFVTNTNDDGVGSLRDTVRRGGVVRFLQRALESETIKLTSGPIMVYVDDVVIDGYGESFGITISGNNTSGVFQIEAGVKATWERSRNLTMPPCSDLLIFQAS